MQNIWRFECKSLEELNNSRYVCFLPWLLWFSNNQLALYRDRWITLLLSSLYTEWCRENSLRTLPQSNSIVLHWLHYDCSIEPRDHTRRLLHCQRENLSQRLEDEFAEFWFRLSNLIQIRRKNPWYGVFYPICMLTYELVWIKSD